MRSIEEIYEAYGHDVFRYLLSLTGKRELAEDVLQETFYRVLIYIDSYKGEEIRPWLFTIAYHAFVDQCRKESRYATTELSEAHLPIQKSAEQAMLLRYEIDTWLQHVSQLSLIRKNIVLLRDYYSFSYREIAQLMSITETKVKMELYRGRQQLKQIREREQ